MRLPLYYELRGQWQNVHRFAALIAVGARNVFTPF